MSNRSRRKKSKSPNVFRFLNTKYGANSYDFGYFESLMLMKLKDMKRYFDKRLYATDEYYDQILRWLNICIRVGECFIDTADDKYDRHWSDDKKVNCRNCPDAWIKKTYFEEKAKEQSATCRGRSFDPEVLYRQDVWEAKARKLFYSIIAVHVEDWSD